MITDVPAIDSSNSLKISAGIDISTSTIRDRSWSTHPPRTAASMPKKEPKAKVTTVVISAMPTVLRIP